jgi:hypothetical protein
MMNPTVEWREMRNERCLFLRFDGQFTAENARNAITTISSLVEKTAGKITMVWECTHMTGFETAAREAWQVFMKELTSKIERIHLVSNKVVIRSGAMVVGVFAGIKITTWATLDEFYTKSQKRILKEEHG